MSDCGTNSNVIGIGTNPYFDTPLATISDADYVTALEYSHDVVSRFDRGLLIQACGGFTKFLSSYDLVSYPSILTRRVGGVPISIGEMAEFVVWTNRTIEQTIGYIDVLLETETGFTFDPLLNEYVPIDLPNVVGVGGVGNDAINVGAAPVVADIISIDQRHAAITLVADYDRFIAGNSSDDLLGQFCSIFANPYKLIGGIKDLLNFKIPSMVEIVDGILERVKSIVERVIDTAKRKFDNLKSNLLTQSGVFQRRLQGLSDMFKPENVERMTKNVLDRIKGAFSNFREITEDVLAFLMFRMCKMTSGLEFDLMASLTQLEQLKTSYEVAKNDLRTNSDMRSRAYLDAGSVRYSLSSRSDMRRQAYQDTSSYSNMGFDSLVERVIQAESGGDPNAVSAVGASGLMQVMPDTAADPGFGVTPLDWNKRFNVDENRRFGTEYLAALLDHFNGDQVKTLVAYNWGVGRAETWDGNMSSLPDETENYVHKILGPNANGSESGVSSVEPSVFAAEDITEEELTWVNSLTSAGDASIRFQPQVLSMGDEATRDWEARGLKGYNAADNYSDAGWKQIILSNPSIYIMLRRVAKRMGITLTFNSAFRSSYYNAYLSGATTGLHGPHTKALAVDVTMRDLSESQRVEFIKGCSQEGFSRISCYTKSQFIHVDIVSGNGRGDWKNEYLDSEAVREAMMLHVGDRFRKG